MLLSRAAQQPAMPVIGFIGSASPHLRAARLRAFHQGLSETGYVEGKNVAIGTVTVRIPIGADWRC
jgi:hypothetical protein